MRFFANLILFENFDLRVQLFINRGNVCHPVRSQMWGCAENRKPKIGGPENEGPIFRR